MKIYIKLSYRDYEGSILIKLSKNLIFGVRNGFFSQSTYAKFDKRILEDVEMIPFLHNLLAGATDYTSTSNSM